MCSPAFDLILFLNKSKGRRGAQGSLLSPSICRVWFSDCWLDNGKSLETKCSKMISVLLPLHDSCSKDCQWSIMWCHLVFPQSLRSSKFMLLLASTLISPKKSCQYLQWGKQLASGPLLIGLMSPLRCVWEGKTHAHKTCVLFLGFGHTQYSAWFSDETWKESRSWGVCYLVT